MKFKLILGSFFALILVLTGCHLCNHHNPEQDYQQNHNQRFDNRFDRGHDRGNQYSVVRSVVKYINEERGLTKTSLKIDRNLNKAAQYHAEDMARRGRMSHRGSDGSEASERIRRFSHRNRQCYAENVAYGQSDAYEVVRDWMNSRGHRTNILNRDYTHLGVGYSHGRDGRIYWCVVFAG